MSASTPAKCHNAPGRWIVSNLRVSSDSLISHCSTRSRAPLWYSSLSSADAGLSSATASTPEREASRRLFAPLPASQRAVRSPSPPVPPVSRCVRASCHDLVCSTCITTLPKFFPVRSERKAAPWPHIRSKRCSGRLCTTPKPMRLASNDSTCCIHCGKWPMSASSATV
eukprot:6596234-Prymnesium_polylepis.1